MADAVISLLVYTNTFLGLERSVMFPLAQKRASSDPSPFWWARNVVSKPTGVRANTNCKFSLLENE